MEINEILKRVDHTLLDVGCTENDIKSVIDDAVTYGCASVCIPPSYVKIASEYSAGRVPICTVIGFPNGYNTASVKAYEAENAATNGADEIDMVINICLLKDRKYDDVLNEIKAVRAACEGKVLKVIIETCLLDRSEKIKMCEIVGSSGADYIKTSTGFSSGGATREDLALFKKYCPPNLKIKAAGGIASVSDAEDFIALGADRLGTSRIVKIVKQENLANNTY